MVPKTPEMANSDVTHERWSLSNAPTTNGEVSSDSSTNKLELVHPAAYPYRILMKFTIDNYKINK